MPNSEFPEGHRLSHIERLVDVIDLPIGRWDAQDRLVFCNTPYLGWAEKTRDELIGRSLREIYGDDAWARAYSRAEGCFPAGTSRMDKYWCPVGRVDNVYGDRNLVCSCPPVTDYAQAAE